MRFYTKGELTPLIQYRGESKFGEWALWTGEFFLMRVDQETVRLQHPEDDLGLPTFNPYKDPVL